MIEAISGTDDSRLEPYRHVGDHDWLRRHGLFVAEGRLVVARAIARGSRIESVLVNRAAHAALGGPLSTAGAPVYVCDDDVLAAVTGFNFHRGCLALVRRPAPAALESLLGATHLLAIEGVGNPDNVGGLFRTAAAFGVGGVLLDAATGDPLYRKAVRTSMGATISLPHVRASEWTAALETLRARGFLNLALTPRAGGDAIGDVARQLGPGDRFVVMVGAEGPGLAPASLDRADRRVTIPIAPSVDSLNVVVAAGIALAFLSPRAGGG
jgi:tRNA G18 (ribose-2'-O)-methylase SpoU